MAGAKEIVLIVHAIDRITENGKEMDVYKTPPPFILGAKEKELRIKGFVNYEVVNTGTTTILLWNSIPLLGGQAYHPNKTNLLPFAENIPFTFEDEYGSTRINTGIPVDNLPPVIIGG